MWMDCILAREKITPELERVINAVKKEWKMYPLSIVSVRNVLTKIGYNKHYKHAPLILKRVSGVGPPDIPDNILVRCKFIFSEVMKAYKFCFNSSNSAGYPYIIYKIFDAGCGFHEHRRILYCIHVQSPRTIANLDKEWNTILKYLVENH